MSVVTVDEIRERQARMMAAWRRLAAAGWQVVRTRRTGRHGWEALLACPLPDRSRPRRPVGGDRPGIWLWQYAPAGPVHAGATTDAGWRRLSELARLADLEVYHQVAGREWPGADRILLAVRPPTPHRTFEALTADVVALVAARTGVDVDYEGISHALWRLVHDDLLGTPLDPGLTDEE